MASEDHEYPETSTEAEDECCTVCQTVYAVAEGAGVTLE
jgi:hypothetical protein